MIFKHDFSTERQKQGKIESFCCFGIVEPGNKKELHNSNVSLCGKGNKAKGGITK